MVKKYILNSISEKKIRALIMIVSVGIAAMLLYIVLFSTQDVKIKSKKMYDLQYGSTDLIIYPKNIEKSYLLPEDLNDDNIDEEVKICNIKSKVAFRDEEVNSELLFMAESSFDKIMNFDIIETNNKDGIIVSKRLSEKYNLKLGDTVKINLDDKEYEISSITNNTGWFYDETYNYKIILKNNYLSDFSIDESSFNVMYCKLKDSSESERRLTIDRLNDKFDNLKVSIIDQSMISQSLDSNLTIPLLVILVVSCIMGFIILYTTATIIINERLPIMGTFLSVGFTKKKIIGILIIEACIYGLIGGFLGLFLGIIISKIIIDKPEDIMSFDWISSLNIHIPYGICSILFAMIISITSVYACAVKIKKFPIKSLILNQIDSIYKKASVKSDIFKMCTSFFVLGIAFVFYGSLAYSILFIVAVCLFIVIGMPIFFKYVVKLLKSKFQMRFPYFYLSLKNSIVSKYLIDNMKLIIITLSIVLLINTISVSVISGFEEMFSAYRSDIALLMDHEDEDVYNYINNNENIESSYYFYSYNSMKVKDENTPISLVQGVELDKYTEFNTYFDYDSKDIMTELNNKDRNILLSKALLDKYKKKIGDEICLISDEGDEYTYKVAGSFNAKMAYLGSFAIINIDNMKNDFKIVYPNSISLKLKNSVNIEEYYKEIKNSEISDKVQSFALETEKRESDQAMAKSFLSIIDSLSIIAIILAVIGITNNIVISFIQRKRIFAIYDSVGMNKSKKKMVLVYESIIMAFICIIIAFFAYLLFIYNVSGILNKIGVYIDINFDLNSFILYSSIAAVEIIISSIAPILFMKKMSIIEELRYE